MHKAMRSLAGALVVFFVGIVAPSQAAAFDLSGGVNAGAVLIGTRPRFALSPHAGVSWRAESGFLFALQDVMSILPAIDAHGVGAYNHVSMLVGYAWKAGRFGMGPSLAIYSVPACGRGWCDRVSGLSPGVRGQIDYYFVGPLGLSVSANVDWLTGSTVLPAGVVATVLAGPLLKWSSE